MSEHSKIQWTDDTHNFWQGCTKVSPGCANCYAEARDKRFADGIHWGPGAPRVRSKDFDAPLRWNEKPWVCDECGECFSVEIFKPSVEFHTTKNENGCIVACRNTTFHRRRVFSLSLGDWLDEAVPIEWLADMLDVIRRCPNLDFLLLTKRPENWRRRLLSIKTKNEELAAWLLGWFFTGGKTPAGDIISGAPPNVWIGCTVENQEYADKRIPELLKIPAVCRFISYEPALGPVDFFKATGHGWYRHQKSAIERKLDCIIVGGESGPKARPFNIEWARATIAQCKAAGVPCFVKQLGCVPMMLESDWRDLLQTPLLSASNRDKVPSGYVSLKLKDIKGGDITEWPADLRVRQFPNPNTR